MKLTQNTKLPDFTFNTAFDEPQSIYSFIDEKPTAIMFLRYLGCTTCQLDLKDLKENYNLFTQKGAQVLVVMQSSEQTIKKEINETTFPFKIALDPAMQLYKEFEILPAKNKLGLASVATIKKVNAAKKAGLQHGEYEGEELQLPAVFVVDKTGNITHAHYAKNLGDMPNATELAELV